jgi:phage virion morphogenesis protein
MVAIVVSLQGVDRVIGVLDSLENAQWDALLRIIGATVEEQTINHFQQQYGPDGPWAPRKDKSPWPILIQTGRLRSSIFNTITGATQVSVGTNVFYGRFHQEGTARMVARPFLGLTDADRQELIDVITNYLEEMANPGGKL